MEIATPGNVVSGELHPGSACYVALDHGADVGCGFVCEWLQFVFLHLNDAHDVVSLNGDLVWIAVFNDDFAVLVTVDADE